MISTNLFRTMKIKATKSAAFLGIILLAVTSFSGSLHAKSSRCSVSDRLSPLELGLALETEFWTAVQEQHINKFTKMVDRTFQGLILSGVITRQDWIDSLTGKTLASFRFENAIASRKKNVLVISYDFFGTGSDVTDGPTVDTWIKKDGVWTMTSTSFVPLLVD